MNLCSYLVIEIQDKAEQNKRYEILRKYNEVKEFGNNTKKRKLHSRKHRDKIKFGY
jgi:hypothetical protein